jgi:hypothetical protein
MTAMTCPFCHDVSDFDGEPQRQVLTCTECGARIAWGVLMPRVVVEPHVDKRFIVVRVQTVANGQAAIVQHVLDKEFAHQVAREIASITAPPVPSVLADPLASEAAQSARAGLGPRLG